jgi:hypothetical protein
MYSVTSFVRNYRLGFQMMVRGGVLEASPQVSVPSRVSLY